MLEHLQRGMLSFQPLVTAQEQPRCLDLATWFLVLDTSVNIMDIAVDFWSRVSQSKQTHRIDCAQIETLAIGGRHWQE